MIRKGRGARGHQPLKGRKPREASVLAHGLTTVSRLPPSGGIKTREPSFGQRQAGRAIADEAKAISGREGFEGRKTCERHRDETSPDGSGGVSRQEGEKP
jgi:hypothetical protein